MYQIKEPAFRGTFGADKISTESRLSRENPDKSPGYDLLTNQGPDSHCWTLVAVDE